MFLHGLLGFGRNFYSLSRRLCPDFKSLIYDQRGHGNSFHKKPYTISALAEDLKALLKETEWEKEQVNLVGHSLGAYVSCLFASRYPECVNRLIMVDGSPWPLAKAGEKIRQMILNLPKAFAHRKEAKNFFQEAVKNKLFSKATADLLSANLKTNLKTSGREQPSPPLNWQFDPEAGLQLLSEVRSHNWPSLIKRLNKPLLILRGENSSHFLKSDFEKSLQLNPLIKGLEVKASGHWIHYEQPQIFLSILKEFLKSH